MELLEKELELSIEQIVGLMTKDMEFIRDNSYISDKNIDLFSECLQILMEAERLTLRAKQLCYIANQPNPKKTSELFEQLKKSMIPIKVIKKDDK